MKLWLTFILLIIFFNSRSQIDQKKKYLFEQIDYCGIHVNDFIKSKLSKNSCNLSISDIEIYNLYNFYLTSFPHKEDFKDGSFIYSLRSLCYGEKPGFFKKKEYFASSQSFIFSQSEILAYAIDGDIFCYHKTDVVIDNLMKVLLGKDVDFAFRISNTNGAIYFGLNRKQVWVFESTQDGVKTYTLQKFVSCCWDELRFIK